MTCIHEWVNYQPLLGEAYKCCAKAGCGIRYDEIKDEELKFQDAVWDPALSGWFGKDGQKYVWQKLAGGVNVLLPQGKRS